MVDATSIQSANDYQHRNGSYELAKAVGTPEYRLAATDITSNNLTPIPVPILAVCHSQKQFMPRCPPAKSTPCTPPNPPVDHTPPNPPLHHAKSRQLPPQNSPLPPPKSAPVATHPNLLTCDHKARHFHRSIRHYLHQTAPISDLHKHRPAPKPPISPPNPHHYLHARPISTKIVSAVELRRHHISPEYHQATDPDSPITIHSTPHS
ncbi:extensin-like [Penaeus monodon]|uniref:extensin-like n=1 Tax=Penaeus monodon TaxID=6687 RepID=UPI0018A7DCED|nr:extensin-like [Penaeus monodon]